MLVWYNEHVKLRRHLIKCRLSDLLSRQENEERQKDVSLVSMESSLASNMISEMAHGKSVLLNFGAPGRLLKRKMAITGFICRLLLFIIFNPIFLLRARTKSHLWKRRKAIAIKLGCFMFPFKLEGQQALSASQGQIIVINHPTLNDPICASLYALNLYPDREIIIPVNLPWFEGLCRYRLKLLKIGIKIVPILTPETAKRLGSNDLIPSVQTALIKNYTTEFAKTLRCGGLAVVAQQATRQRYIFTDSAQLESGTGILSTVSLILAGLRRDKLLEQACFVPVGVIPHDIHAKPKLNLFRKYTLNVGKSIVASDLIAIKNDAKRPADLYMLQKIAELMPLEYRIEH